MAENRGKQALGIGAGQREFVGVADAGGLDLDHDLAFARAIELHRRDFERFSGGNGDCGANVHGDVLLFVQRRYVDLRRHPQRNWSLPHTI